MSFSAPKRSSRLRIMKESLALDLQPESKSLKGSGWRSRRVTERMKRRTHVGSSVACPETVWRENVLKWLMPEHWLTADLSLMCTWNRLCNWSKYAPEANTSLNICLIIMSYEIWYGLHFLILDGTKKNLDWLLPWRKKAFKFHAGLNLNPTRWQAWSESENGCLSAAEEEIALGVELAGGPLVSGDSPSHPSRCLLYSGTA